MDWWFWPVVAFLIGMLFTAVLNVVLVSLKRKSLIRKSLHAQLLLGLLTDFKPELREQLDLDPPPDDVDATFAREAPDDEPRLIVTVRRGDATQKAAAVVSKGELETLSNLILGLGDKRPKQETTRV